MLSHLYLLVTNKPNVVNHYRMVYVVIGFEET